MWAALELKFGFPPKILNIVKALHKETSGAVRACGKVSEEVFSKTGVIQGSVLAPNLFELFFDTVISMSLQQHSENELSILFNTEAELVGNRTQMRD